jgi:hypothetical protein
MRRSACNILRGGPSPRRTTQVTVPAFIDTALVKPRGTLSPQATVRQMAQDMLTGSYREGGVSADELVALGYTRAQVKTHGDDARQLATYISGASL